MNDPVVWPVLGGILALLAVATLFSESLHLKQRRALGAATETVTNLRARVRAWWAMVAVLVVTGALGVVALFVLYALLSMLALREFLTLSPTERADHRTLTWVFFLLVPAHYFVAAIGWYVMFLILVPVYAFVLIPVTLALGGETNRFLDRSAKIQWAVLTCVYFVSYVPMLQLIELNGDVASGPRLVLFLVLVSQISDVLQYVSGKLLGKHPIAPTVSPSKTREGFFLGGAGAVAIAGVLHFLTPFGVLGGVMLGLVVVLAGFVGGLVMSAVKRSLGAKDWGHSVPGHGGVLDRLDSLIFSAPVFFHLVVYYADVRVGHVVPSWVVDALHFGS